VAFFASVDAASSAVSGIIGAGIIPSLEMMDNLPSRRWRGIQAGLPLDAGALVLIELDGIVDAWKKTPRVSRLSVSSMAVKGYALPKTRRAGSALEGRKEAFGRWDA